MICYRIFYIHTYLKINKINVVTTSTLLKRLTLVSAGSRV